MAFPERIELNLVDKDGIPIPLGNVFFLGHLFAHYRNDYYIGPYWSDGNGAFVIEREEVEEDVNADRSKWGMDYASTLEQCKPILELELLDQLGLEGLLKGARTWGLVGPNLKKWKTVEEYEAFVRSNNNKLVAPGKIQIDLSAVKPGDTIHHSFQTEKIGGEKPAH